MSNGTFDVDVFVAEAEQLISEVARHVEVYFARTLSCVCGEHPETLDEICKRGLKQYKENQHTLPNLLQ